MQQTFSFVSIGPLFDHDFLSRNGAKILLAQSNTFCDKQLSTQEGVSKMTYRGFDLVSTGENIAIYEGLNFFGRCVSIEGAHLSIDAALQKRRIEDAEENQQNFRR